jgi:hypothetical protein
MKILKHINYSLIKFFSEIMELSKKNIGDGDIIRCCGLIMEWEIYAKKTGTLKIIVWRPTNKAGEESKRTIVGINTFTVVLNTNKNKVFLGTVLMLMLKSFMTVRRGPVYDM